jgi:hypothetical protein
MANKFARLTWFAANLLRRAIIREETARDVFDPGSRRRLGWRKDQCADLGMPDENTPTSSNARDSPFLSTGNAFFRSKHGRQADACRWGLVGNSRSTDATLPFRTISARSEDHRPSSR